MKIGSKRSPEFSLIFLHLLVSSIPHKALVNELMLNEQLNEWVLVKPSESFIWRSWHSTLSHCLQFQHLLSRASFKTWLLSFWFSSLLVLLGRQQKMLYLLRPYYLCRRLGWSSWFLAAAWYALGFCGHLGSETKPFILKQVICWPATLFWLTPETTTMLDSGSDSSSSGSETKVSRKVQRPRAWPFVHSWPWLLTPVELALFFGP